MDNSVECPRQGRFLCGDKENRTVRFKILFLNFLGGSDGKQGKCVTI
jgi:hypothetical protein